MNSEFAILYEDRGGIFYEELYPLASETLQRGKCQLLTYVPQKRVKKWQNILSALISVAHDMCWYELEQLLRKHTSNPSTMSYTHIALAIERTLSEQSPLGCRT